MILQTLTSSEEEIMQLIWSKGKIYFRDLMNDFPEPKPHQNTVSTFLKILVEKHYLKTEKQGRIYLYSPVVDIANYKKFILNNFLKNHFDNSGTELLKLLLKEKLLNIKDFNQFFEGKTSVVPLNEEKVNPIKDFIREITSDKKKKKKDKKKKKKK